VRKSARRQSSCKQFWRERIVGKSDVGKRKGRIGTLKEAISNVQKIISVH